MFSGTHASTAVCATDRRRAHLGNTQNTIPYSNFPSQLTVDVAKLLREEQKYGLDILFPAATYQE